MAETFNQDPFAPLINLNLSAGTGRGLADMTWSITQALGARQACDPVSGSNPCPGDHTDLWIETLIINFSGADLDEWSSPPSPVTFAPLVVPPNPGYTTIATQTGSVVDGPVMNIENQGDWRSGLVITFTVKAKKVFGETFCFKPPLSSEQWMNGCVADGLLDVIEFSVDASNVQATSLDGSILHATATMVQEPPSEPMTIWVLLEK